MTASPGDDDGSTLVEVLMAVVILSLTVAAVLGGLFTSITISDVHRKQATAGAVARDYAEKVAGATYVECAAPAAYALTPASVPVPTGFAANVEVAYWNGGGWATTCSSAGLQRVTVTVSSVDGRATERSVVVVRQR